MFQILSTVLMLLTSSVLSVFISQTPIECLLRKDVGDCSGNHPRFYFDTKSERCLPFRYSGCGGNRNRFKTASACMRQCSNSDDREYERLDGLTADHCRLSRRVGSCNERILRYYYNHYSHECKPFWYSGCGGNANNYLTMAECRQSCHPLSFLHTTHPDREWNGIRWYHHLTPNQHPMEPPPGSDYAAISALARGDQHHITALPRLAHIPPSKLHLMHPDEHYQDVINRATSERRH